MIIIDTHLNPISSESTGVFSGLSKPARKALGILATNPELCQEFLSLPQKSWDLLESNYGCGGIELKEREVITTLFQTFICPGSSVTLTPQMACWVDCHRPI